MILDYNLPDFCDEEGCCLNCPEAYPGCLCYDCKCRKCARYDCNLHRCSISVINEDRRSLIYYDEYSIIHETEAAYLISIDDKEFWLPKSLIDFEISLNQDIRTEIADPKVLAPDEAVNMNIPRLNWDIGIPKWLALKEGIYELDKYDYSSNEEDYYEVYDD